MDVVFHCSSADTTAQDHALSNARNLLADDTVDTEAVAFVANGEAVRAFLEGSHVAGTVRDLVDEVRFVVCSNSLAGRDIDADRLLDGVETGSSGMGTLAELQAEGHHYVKVP
ncbi:DsrE family protein [Halomarina litorea]|uniref:DsrE family protein n=1 Tax=Halomarina litorea TaxID=2961595 RepID=UPI0020C38878|nr:DsrE family protein [Halomarina sp. BCD28]